MHCVFLSRGIFFGYIYWFKMSPAAKSKNFVVLGVSIAANFLPLVNMTLI
jgi:hypothetical protein